MTDQPHIQLERLSNTEKELVAQLLVNVLRRMPGWQNASAGQVPVNSGVELIVPDVEDRSTWTPDDYIAFTDGAHVVVCRPWHILQPIGLEDPSIAGQMAQAEASYIIEVSPPYGPDEPETRPEATEEPPPIEVQANDCLETFKAITSRDPRYSGQVRQLIAKAQHLMPDPPEGT